MFRFVCPLVFLATSVDAQCPAGALTLMSCTLKNGAKQVTTCLQGDQARYVYGVPGRSPELSLMRSVREVDMRPWPGVGSTLWEEFTFRNKDISYAVHYSVERKPEGQVSGGVTVLHGDRELASFSCDPGTVVSAGFGSPLFEAKERAGQSYSLETQSWN